MGRTEEEIAGALGITTRTLAKHYFHELGYRRSARMHLEAMNLGAIVEQVRAGKVAAMSLLDRRLERMARTVPQRPAAPVAKPGLKEQRRAAAQVPTGEWAELLPRGGETVQ